MREAISCPRASWFIAVGMMFLVAAAGGSAEDSPAANRPNIIFILTDDQGWGDGDVFGHPYMRTPSIDRLVREGCWFRQFYVNNPVCSPSRTAFMTGHFPARHRVHGHFARWEQNEERGMPNWLDSEVTTVCDVLRSAGYATAHFGKWHLGNGEGAPGPGDYGVDDHRTLVSPEPGWDVSADPYFWAHSTGLFVDETIRFIKKSASEGKPFYVNLWTLVPHATLKPTPEELAVYEGLVVSPLRFESYMRSYVAEAEDMNAQLRVFSAAMTGLDREIGRLLDFLDEAGLAENTVLFFASDNGPEDYHIGNAKNAGMGSPGHLRARKRSIYEGGVRVPFIVRWPGEVEAGRVDGNSVLTAVDFLPTVCSLAGIAMPDAHPDGEDVADILAGTSRPRGKPIFWEWRFKVFGDPEYAPPPLAVREGDWKLFTSFDGETVELYNIPKDPEERSNVADGHPETVEGLRKMALDWKRGLPE